MSTSGQKSQDGAFGIRRLALLALGLAGSADGVDYTSTAKKRWTNQTSAPWVYNTDETYTDVLGNSEKFRMEWEMYEGSIALTQMAVVWKEISSQLDLQVYRTTATKTTEVMRIRRIWQLASKGASLDIYDDEQGQLTNDFANMEYINPSPRNGNEWFVGDVVPFENCAYVVNLNSDASKKYYRFSRLTTAVMWDPIFKAKKVVTQISHTSDEYTKTQSGVNSKANNDFPQENIQMSYWPQKGSFFWFVNGWIHLKHDAQADMTDTCNKATLSADPTLNRCDRSSLKDPCARDTPLFASGTSLQHHSLKIASTTEVNNYAISFETVFDSLFVIFDKQKHNIIRIGGTAFNTLEVSDFFMLNAVTTWSTFGEGTTAKTVTSSDIEGICSMDFHGLFLQVKNQNKVVRLEMIVKEDAGQPDGIKKDGNGLVEMETKSVYHVMTMPNPDKFRLYQTKGFYARHRPCYYITESKPTQLQRLTTQITTFFPKDPVPANPIDLYTKSWSEGSVPQGPQLMRFHMFKTMPGLVDDAVALADLDYDTIKAFIYDIRSQKEWGKFALTSAGNGVVDVASGEECEPLQKPPLNLYYDNNESGDYAARMYPDATVSEGDATTLGTPVPDGYVSWIGENEVKDESGSTARAEYMPKGYYTCTSSAFLVPYIGCGDGVPSNGPPDVSVFNAKHQRNQRNGNENYEVCDDGGLPGDGCADDCKSITDGYECLRWGAACTPKCGNGHVEGSIDPITGEFVYELDAGGLQREECDFGTHNAPLNYADITDIDFARKFACSKDCKFIENKFTTNTNALTAAKYPKFPKKWDCDLSMLKTPVASPVDNNKDRVVYEFTCTYLCGNRVIDKNVDEPDRSERCDIGGWGFTGMGNTGYSGEATDDNGDVDGRNWVDTKSDPKKNPALGLGCTVDCVPYIDGTNHFVYDADNFSSKGTDRCGDGFMDGPIPLTFAADGVTPATFYRAGDFPTCQPQDPFFWAGTCQITGYTSYWPLENYSARIISEQCDNGGDTEHGCDRLCQVMDGWECFHYYHNLIGLELPLFTSICQEKDLKTLSRRLSPADFDSKGRILHDMPRRTQYFTLPDNAHEMRPGKHTLYQDPKKGLNGQVRIFEDTTCLECFGIIFGYSRDLYTNPDYVYMQWMEQDAANTGGVPPGFSIRTLKIDQNDVTGGRLMAGKQRNTFGKYAVMNHGKDTILFKGWKASGEVTFYDVHTTPAEASVEYLGSHELYWFPYKQLLMSKLSDGSSFRFHRFTKDFIAAAEDYAGAKTFNTKDQIDSGEFRLWHIPGRTMLPPVFQGQMAYFYISGADVATDPMLKAYRWNDLTNTFEEKCTKTMPSEASMTALYHKFSMVNTGEDGIIWSSWATASFGLYNCSSTDQGLTWAWTKDNAAVTIDNSAGALTGASEDLADTAITTATMMLQQAREDPDNYVAGTPPTIYGLHNNGYIQEFTWDGVSRTLSTVAPSIVIPIDKAIVASPEWFDVGRRHLVLLAPSDCTGIQEVDYILNASAHFYNLAAKTWSCRDLDGIKGDMDRSTGSTLNEHYWTHTGTIPYPVDRR